MTSITPFLTHYNAPDELKDKVFELAMKDAALRSGVHPSLREPLQDLMKVVNSYYSNKIEGNSTHPRDVLRASEDAFTSRQDSKDVLEVKRDIEVQVQLESIEVKPEDVSSEAFIKGLHKRFYEGAIEDQLQIENFHTGEMIDLVPGELRTQEVDVGKHLAPLSEDLPALMSWFHRVYRLDYIHGTDKLLAAAASHHRLMHIHPFLDGNGRVGRLFTGMYLKMSGLDGHGLWSMSRGFARDTKSYYKALAEADKVRQGDIDGKGILSDKGLAFFMSYFVDTALDQVNFFDSLFEPRMLATRIDLYFDARGSGSLPDGTGGFYKPLKPEARAVYHYLLRSGGATRKQIEEHIGVSERKCRDVLKEMSNAGLIETPARGPVMISLSPSSLEFLFPKLW